MGGWVGLIIAVCMWVCGFIFIVICRREKNVVVVVKKRSDGIRNSSGSGKGEGCEGR